MADVRRIMIIFVVTVLYAVFVFSLDYAINTPPKYEDYCRQMSFSKPVAPLAKDERCASFNVSLAEQESCQARHGQILYDTDSNGCAISYRCDTCQYLYDQAREHSEFWRFLLSAVFGLAALIVGLWLPTEKNALNEWMGTGFLLGGFVTLFIGTAITFNNIFRWLRPIIIFLELVLVIFIAYRKLKIHSKDDKRKKR
jgi:hypothetical protein